MEAIRKTKGTPDEVDVYVGARLRARRAELGLSQEKLAEKVGLTFQQVQKYERGSNRVAAGRLYQFAQVLGTPITYFFPDDPQQLEHAPSFAKQVQAYERGFSRINKLAAQISQIAGGV